MRRYQIMMSMNPGTMILIALALALDAFAVAVAAGVALGAVSRRQTFRLAWHFGLFQALMTIAGWAAGLSFRSLIESADHWLAFGLLALVAAKMIGEAGGGAAGEKQRRDPTRGARLVMLAVATSIDALAVGLSLSLLQIVIWPPALLIGGVAALLTAAGLHLGRLCSAATRWGARLEVAGGLLLFGLGLNILHSHGVF